MFMGLVDGDPATGDDCDDECPLTDEDCKVLVTASSHTFYRTIRKEGVNDGYLEEESAHRAVGFSADDLPQ